MNNNQVSEYFSKFYVKIWIFWVFLVVLHYYLRKLNFFIDMCTRICRANIKKVLYGIQNFFNISSTKKNFFRLNLCHALKSRIKFRTIEWLLNAAIVRSFSSHNLWQQVSHVLARAWLQSQLYLAVGRGSNGHTFLQSFGITFVIIVLKISFVPADH